MEDTAFREQLRADQAAVEQALHRVFQEEPHYADLDEAMDYSLLAGGKRIRPVLVLETCRLCGGDPEAAMPFACGLEMVHTYSLIHDDLPAMDNDDLRRGRPTNHRDYGEATAILAGDGLLTAAFSQLAQAPLSAAQVVDGVACLARAAGPKGMVGGQALDLAGEGRTLDVSALEQLQSLKTGALISAAVELGCIAAGGTAAQRAAVLRYAPPLGRAFQIRDDILDVIGSQAELGKEIGSDQANEKSTFVTALGLERCDQLVHTLTDQAVAALAEFEHPEFHIWLARQMVERTK